MIKRAMSFSLIIVVAIYALTVYFKNSAWMYSEEKHIERVSALVEKKYMQDGGEYNDYTVYPLYDENDKLGYFIVEFEPHGFVYVKIREFGLESMLWKCGMYLEGKNENKSWYRYDISEGNIAVLGDYRFNDIYWTELDEYGCPIEHKDSHYKAAGIGNEKRYLLTTIPKSQTELYIRGFIPAVKRGDNYLNLISMSEWEYAPVKDLDEDSSSKQPIADICFSFKFTLGVI